jgi:hypothetical protein
MNALEYNLLQSERDIITALDLENKEDRTLLFCVKHSPNTYVYHIYIHAGVIYSVCYPSIAVDMLEHRSINSDKDWAVGSVYAKHSDFEFVKLLVDSLKGSDVTPHIMHPDNTCKKHKNKSVYHGAVLPGHDVLIKESP